MCGGPETGARAEEEVSKGPGVGTAGMEAAGERVEGSAWGRVDPASAPNVAVACLIAWAIRVFRNAVRGATLRWFARAPLTTSKSLHEAQKVVRDWPPSSAIRV